MSDAPTRRALLIGINAYPNLSGFSQLQGCVNDVRLMAGVLKDTFGFAEEHITLLADEQATRDGILRAMQALAEQVGENDIVVVHYAGHGSQITDREGDEPDGFDSTIVPHDAGRPPLPNRDITDDEVYAWLLPVTEKTPFVTLIFDCCHSGTIARDDFGEHARWVEPDTRPVEQLPPSPVAGFAGRGARADKGPSGWLPPGRRYVLMAGCRDDECSYEYHDTGQDVRHGALTYFLARELVRARPGTTYRDVYERVASRVTANAARQHPQMEGARDRELFGVRDIEPMRFVPVGPRVGSTVRLAAGAAHGLTAGSEWAVYPSETKQVAETTARLGRVQVTAVRATTSDARILEESEAGIIAEGTRAVEEAHAYGDMRLRVAIQVPAGFEEHADRLWAAVEGTPLLRTAETREPADICAYVVAPREAAAGDDPVPQLGPVDEAVWAVVGKDGKLAMPVHEIRRPDVIALLRDNLEKLARFRQALALENPDPDGLLRGKIDFVLKRRAAGGAWVEAEPDTAGGEIVYHEGERLAMTITNHHTEPVYLNILDFGLSGAVGLLYPIPGANEPLAPGASFDIGVREGDELELHLPDNYPFVRDPGDEPPLWQGPHRRSGAVEGLERLKLFATTHEADFSPLLQAGVRGVEGMPGADSPLGQLLTLACTGHGTRDLRRTRPRPTEAWTTVTRSFLVRRPAFEMALPPDEADVPSRASPARGDGGAPAVDEDVQFTVYRPDAVRPGRWYDLLAFAHLAGRIDDVQRRAGRLLGDQAAPYGDLTQDSRAAIPRGATLRFVPVVEGITFNPPELAFLWMEDIHQVAFRLRASEDLDGKTARGLLTVYLGHIVLAEVSLRLRVSREEAPEVAAPPATAEHARPYRKIFVSYSHKDLDVVKEVERFATLMGDEYVRDWTHLRAGQAWSDALLHMIDEADIVQLFWSTHSMKSEYVKQEWEYALSLGRPNFLRPVYWEDPFPTDPERRLPPPELGRLHFQKIDL